ncbi:biofilm development regulator YmgB/AriR family protein [Enterobacter sp. DE0047]|uniref:biofilm development regulator YmgB/AriR family protein n=1 Tax=Enterobacter sp. DE0047 TaxID=2584949 RepID=UPI0011AADCE9|nr:biofilm development regulator YmgB/AriR family protein [Enterobacter sp. DE0047]
MHSATTEDTLNTWFEQGSHAFEAERTLIRGLAQNLKSNRIEVNNKNMILALIRLLETEDDVIKLDVYRNALELIVQKTPDDL